MSDPIVDTNPVCDFCKGEGPTKRKRITAQDLISPCQVVYMCQKCLAVIRLGLIKKTWEMLGDLQVGEREIRLEETKL